MKVVNFESDYAPGTILRIVKTDDGDVILNIRGNGEMRIATSGGKLHGENLVSCMKGIDEVIAALEAQERGETEPKPLTTDELRIMQGDRIDIRHIGQCEGFYKDVIAPYFGTFEQYICNHDGRLTAVHLPLEHYGKQWLAYRF